MARAAVAPKAYTAGNVSRRELSCQGGIPPELRLMGGGLRAVDRENSPYRNFPCRCSVPKIFSAGRFLNFRNELTARRDFSSDFRNELTAPPDAISKTRFFTVANQRTDRCMAMPAIFVAQHKLRTVTPIASQPTANARFSNPPATPATAGTLAEPWGQLAS